MAKLSGYYDPNDKPESFEVLPAGTYTVKIAASEWKRTKKGDGQYLQFEMTICEGDYKDRKVYDRFNLDNPSKEAMRIARGQFASLREAVGILDPKDSAELMGPRFTLTLKCERRRDDPEKMTNAVARYIKRGVSESTPRQQPAAPPWSRNAPRPESSPPTDPFTSPGAAGEPPW